MDFMRRDGTSAAEPLEAIAPIFKATARGLEILGTGFFVTSCGTMFTAAHVATQWEPGTDLLVFHKEFQGPMHSLRRVIQIIPHPIADVAVLRLESVTSETTQQRLRCGTLRITVDVPPVQTRVGCWGFPQSVLLPPNAQYDGFAVALERGSAEGLIEEHFPNGRDRVIQPGECFQTSMNTMGGASGGPVFNERGEAFAVVSSGFDEHTTYVAPIRDLALAKIYKIEQPPKPPEVVNLMEYVERY
jgi:hypothetical protein